MHQMMFDQQLNAVRKNIVQIKNFINQAHRIIVHFGGGDFHIFIETFAKYVFGAC